MTKKTRSNGREGPCPTPSLFPDVVRDATFSACGRYRYVLRRIWNPAVRPLAIVGLNPSTADAVQDDPTIQRCIRFARERGSGGLIMLNLFAFRSTDPAGLYTVADPVGPENDRYIEHETFGTGAVLAAWGAHPAAQRIPGVDGSRAEQVVRMRVGGAWVALGLTKDGHPRHPLYVRADAPFVPFKLLAEVRNG